jgi:hypothetical protein
MIRCAWCDGLVWPWQDTAPRIFNHKIVEMHLSCAADSIVEEVKAINERMATRAQEIARSLQRQSQTRPISESRDY